ncbi:MAG: nucleotidyltransferase domain-containing protein [Nanoarchaeota archaeon]|nr:nucleotidyltransferase domain-containing protein [Nanoarchaeota archaeon]
MNCKKFKEKNESIVDIIIYGSFVKGKTNVNDVDIMLLFLDKPLRERSEITQKLKNILKKEIKNIDVKSMNLLELFDEHFFARQNLLIEGHSILNKKPFAELLGFKGYALFTYNLKNLSHKQKVMFNYALSGRTTKGLLKESKGNSLGKGVAKIPIKNSINFEEFLQKWKINYKVEYTLVSIL